MSDIPIELLNAIKEDINDVLKKHLENYNGNILPLLGTVFLKQLGTLLDAIKKTKGLKEAKNLRTIFSQRIHAYPLDKDNNDVH